MTQPTAYMLSLRGATWVDVNTLVSQDNLPDRIPDSLSITHSSLRNLFNCNIGERGKIFQPEYGSEWRLFLQEPIDLVTAAKMRIAMIQAIARWEPRLTLNYSQCSITPNLSIPGYEVRIVGVDTLSKTPLDIRFNETAGQP
jgi:phage baseplate assembly protein W